ncbi:hypothetical protein BJ138DRAFT_1145547 [Hygrophoropsis aurantiaca]|uniref:Uncharacterized protein n=1 Tax=Hygrophoropsis aurantiaca TaxID=72124 RepID=A0ACB8AJI7_9AGAM|nr:hypothetical protein BJ138DRAFT_1145547 [Hygrophoropsis aurantiaca]
MICVNTTTSVCIGGTLKVTVNIVILGEWLYIAFMIVMQVIILLRVHVLYNCSKKILTVLMAILGCQTVVAITSTILTTIESTRYGNNRLILFSSSRTIYQTFEVKEALVLSPMTPGPTLLMILFFFDTLLFALATVAFVKHVFQVRKLSGRWSMNPLTKLLFTDHALYFICFVSWQILYIGPYFDPSILDSILEKVVYNFLSGLVVVLGPRMVIKLRIEDLKRKRHTPYAVLPMIQFHPGDITVQPELDHNDDVEI